MMRLRAPARTFGDAIDACVEGITGNDKLRDTLIAGRNELLAVEPIYVAEAVRGALFAIAPADDNLDDATLLVGGLCRPDLIKLYDQYLVPKGKPGRKVYSDLLNAALEECPFCGGIGTPKTLDHFLPKGKHPVFSILPHNLVPSCRDCNMGDKGQGAANLAEEVVLQPYVDKDIFFNQQWIFSSYEEDISGDPGVFSYFVETPDTWDAIDTARAEHHFKIFDLAHKYGLKAAQSLVTVMGQANAMLNNGLSRDDVMKIILQPGIDCAPFPNHWQRGMYQALHKYFA